MFNNIREWLFLFVLQHAYVFKQIRQNIRYRLIEYCTPRVRLTAKFFESREQYRMIYANQCAMPGHFFRFENVFNYLYRVPALMTARNFLLFALFTVNPVGNHYVNRIFPTSKNSSLTYCQLPAALLWCRSPRSDCYGFPSRIKRISRGSRNFVLSSTARSYS